MTTETFYRTSRILAILTVASMLACCVPQAAQAQLIAYDGFDYAVGNLTDVANGALGGGFGWATEIDPINNIPPGSRPVPEFNVNSGVNYGWDDRGWLSVPSNNDPGVNVVDNPVGWGYTDSLGQSLQTTGKALAVTNWDRSVRNFDLSSLDPSLVTTSNANGSFPNTLALGVSGTEVWISFLTQGTATGEGESTALITLIDGFGQGEAPKLELGRPANMQLDGTADSLAGNVAFGARSKQSNEVASTGTSWDDKIFMVARIRFLDPGDPIPGDPTNAFGDELVDVWVNPDLGSTAPSNASAAIADLVLWDSVLEGIWINGGADTNFDELRVGFSYGDVAPIAAAGLDGDFDVDGDVDGADFLKWQRDLGDATNLALWESNFGAAPAIAATAAVPEPSSLLMASILLAIAARCRPDRSSSKLLNRE